MPRSPRPPHTSRPRRLLPPTAVPAAVRQIAAVAAIGAIGTTALAAGQGAAPAAVAPASAGIAAPAAHRVDAGRPAPALYAAAPAKNARTAGAKPATKKTAKPAGHTQSRHTAAPSSPWIPSGTGMWIYEWDKSNGGNAGSIVARARRTGLTHLFVRTGSSHDHYTGAGLLHALLPATRNTGIKVVAWDFPELDQPKKDAWRLAYAAWADYRAGVPHVAAVAPDIETPAEGTRTSALRVSTYLRELRRLLPKDVAILTTVPWPSSQRVGIYPYAAVAAYSDAILPMAYWYDNSPQVVTATSISFLRRYHRPVLPVGQGYDGKLDVPSLRHNHLGREVPAFFATAHQMGARSVSLWSWQAAPPVAWAKLAWASRLFPPHS